MQAMLLCATCGLPAPYELEDPEPCPECGGADCLAADGLERFLSCTPA